MKITIEPESDAEKKLLAEPWVRTGCIRFGLSGYGDVVEGNATGEFGFLHGDNIGIQGDLARLAASLNMQSMAQTAVNGVLQANQMLQRAQAEQAIAQEVLGNRNGNLRIHRP